MMVTHIDLQRLPAVSWGIYGLIAAISIDLGGYIPSDQVSEPADFMLVQSNKS